MNETSRVPKHPFPASFSPDSRLATRDSRRSLIPFKTGDQVIELIGPECMRDRRQVRIIEMGDDHVVTETGHVYTRRGTSIPRDDTPYRSIISPDYAQPGCHCSPSAAQQCSPDLTTSPSPDTPRRQDGDAHWANTRMLDPKEATDGSDGGQT